MADLLTPVDQTDEGGGSGATPGVPRTATVLEEAVGRPVVTLDGHDPAGIDGVLTDDDGTATAFALAKRSLFGGALEETLPLEHVIAVGPDAVVVADATALRHPDPDPEEPQPAPSAPVVPETTAQDPAAVPMRLRATRKRAVVASDSGESVGRVDKVVVDPSAGRIGSIRLDKTVSDVRFLSWRDLTTFGTDGVEIPTAEVLRKQDGPREKGVRRDYQILGKTVITTTGEVLGEVEDVEFDAADGRITRLFLDEGELAGARLIGLGTHAAVVTAG